MKPRALPPELSGAIDPNGGFLCMTVHWRPQRGAPTPEMPGEKVSMSSYLRRAPATPCLCGSGRLYRTCCRPQRYWRPVCPNPDMTGYSLVAPQTATFDPVDGSPLRERLMAERRLHCVDTSLPSSFWLFWGAPPVQEPYGILCFGDVELKDNTTLLLTAMSDLRMQRLLAVLHECTGEYLGAPRLSYDPVPLIDKQTGKLVSRAPSRQAKAVQGR